MRDVTHVTEAVIYMGWNTGSGTKLDGLRTIVAALTHQRGEMIRKIVNEAGDAVGQTNLDGMLIKGHERIDAELKHRRKLFFSTGGALVGIHCITQRPQFAEFSLGCLGGQPLAGGVDLDRALAD